MPRVGGPAFEIPPSRHESCSLFLAGVQSFVLAPTAMLDCPSCVGTPLVMEITFDLAKRDATLANRGLDFADAELVFEGLTFSATDDRIDYGERRVITFGYLAGRMVVVVWTARSAARHIISMRKANEREQARYRERLGQDRRPRDPASGV